MTVEHEENSAGSHSTINAVLFVHQMMKAMCLLMGSMCVSRSHPKVPAKMCYRSARKTLKDCNETIVASPDCASQYPEPNNCLLQQPGLMMVDVEDTGEKTQQSAAACSTQSFHVWQNRIQALSDTGMRVLASTTLNVSHADRLPQQKLFIMVDL